MLVACLGFPRCVLASVVGTGTPTSCTEAALDTALGCGAPSGRAPASTCTSSGAITFNCGSSPTTITVKNRKGVAANTSIDGGGLVTLSGGGTTGILGVSIGVTLTVANLTISDGASHAAGSDTRGAAISNAGTLMVTHSTLSANNNADFGAAINSGMLTVSDSTFSGNSAIEGAAIWSGNMLVVIANSTFSGNGNSANADGAAIYNSKTGTVTASNSTFSGNSAEFAGAISNLNSIGPVTLTNTIVANSSAGGNCDFSAGSPSSTVATTSTTARRAASRARVARVPAATRSATRTPSSTRQVWQTTADRPKPSHSKRAARRSTLAMNPFARHRP